MNSKTNIQTNFQEECVKQLRRCGFEKIRSQTFDLDGKEAFLLEAEK